MLSINIASINGQIVRSILKSDSFLFAKKVFLKDNYFRLFSFSCVYFKFFNL